MTFPFTITINDEQEFNRLISVIGKPIAAMAADETALRFGKSKTSMSKADCYKESTRACVDKAIKSGQLKGSYDSGKWLTNRTLFNTWKLKNTF